VYTVSVMTPAARGQADTGPLQVWLPSTSLTSANFTGTLGHHYTFVVSATDYVSNTGQASAATDAVQVTKYYYIGSTRVAMRQGDAVTYLHTDHLGTVSIATNQSQAVLARTLNLPYGGVRWSTGAMPTDYGFTGQKDTGLGLVYMHARYYSSFTGRFISPDTVVPQAGNPQAWNRYSYTVNNPLKYTDPSGHCFTIITGDTMACIALLAALVAAAFYAIMPPPPLPKIYAPPAAPEDVTWTQEQIRRLHDDDPNTTPEPPIRDPGPFRIPTPEPQTATPTPTRVATDTPTPEQVIRVRHYSQSITEIRSSMVIKSDRIAIFAEYPIITPYEEQAIQRTSRSFMRPLDRQGGFVEFNVDLRKWRVEPDPNLQDMVTNAVRIRPKPLTLFNEFPLNELGVNPIFYNWRGRPLE